MWQNSSERAEFIFPSPHRYYYLLGLALVFFALIAFGHLSKKKYFRAICINLGSIGTLFVVLELSLQLGLFPLGKRSKVKDEFSTDERNVNFYALCITPQKNTCNNNDPDLGWNFPANSTVSLHKLYREQMLYDVVYRTDKNGLRLSPEAAYKDSPAALFLGCSYTFGEGLQDSETYPAEFQFLIGNRIKALNFGVPGYGPNHALRLLELNRERPALDGKSVYYVFYLAIPDHIRRAATSTAVTRGGPDYEIGRDHELHYERLIKGSILMDPNSVVRNSLVLSWLSDQMFFTPKERQRQLNDEQNVERFVSIIRKISQITRSRYGVPLTVLLYEWYDHPKRQYIKNALEDVGVTVIDIDSELPQLKDHRRFNLPHDGHPNAKAAKLIAEHLVLRLKLKQ